MHRDIPWHTLEYLIVKEPYMHDRWIYHVQYWWKNRWNTTQSSGFFGGSYDTTHWELRDARNEITRLKRGHDIRIVEEV